MFMTPEHDPKPALQPAPSIASSLAWKRIADALEEDIRAGRYGAGDILPPSIVLAEGFGVHRHTVRQAFKHLAERGLVSVERGRGTEVLAQRFPYRIGRRVSLRSNFGAAGIPVAGEIVSSTIVEASKPIAEMLAIAPGQRVFAIRTLNRANRVPVSSGLHYVDALRFPTFDRLLAEAGASISGALKASGIADYIRLSTRLSARAASAEEAALLEIAPGAPVLQSISIDGLPDRSPVQCVEGVFVGDRMEMIVEPFAEE